MRHCCGHFFPTHFGHRCVIVWGEKHLKQGGTVRCENGKMVDLWYKNCYKTLYPRYIRCGHGEHVDHPRWPPHHVRFSPQKCLTVPLWIFYSFSYFFCFLFCFWFFPPLQLRTGSSKPPTYTSVRRLSALFMRQWRIIVDKWGGSSQRLIRLSLTAVKIRCNSSWVLPVSKCVLKGKWGTRQQWSFYKAGGSESKPSSKLIYEKHTCAHGEAASL